MHLPERAGRLLVEVHPHDERLAERPANLDEAGPGRVDAQDVADEQRLPRRLRRRDDGLGRSQRVGERLFAENVRAGLERLEGHRRVVLGIGGDRDRIRLQRFKRLAELVEAGDAGEVPVEVLARGGVAGA